MHDYKKETLKTYETEAENIADKFSNIGPRIEDIERAFSLLATKKKDPFVLELGCGNGRDAKIIRKYTSKYLGIDYSKNLINFAREQLPETDFSLEDIEEFIFPDNIDLIFAFASLLHIDKTNLQSVLDRANEKLNTGGIFYISLKKGNYQKKRETKVHGPRTFFYYDTETLKPMIEGKYDIDFEETQLFRGKDWLTIVLKKI